MTAGRQLWHGGERGPQHNVDYLFYLFIYLTSYTEEIIKTYM